MESFEWMMPSDSILWAGGERRAGLETRSSCAVPRGAGDAHGEDQQHSPTPVSPTRRKCVGGAVGHTELSLAPTVSCFLYNRVRITPADGLQANGAFLGV